MTCDSLIDRYVTNQDGTIHSVHVHKKANSTIAKKSFKRKSVGQRCMLCQARSRDDRFDAEAR